MWSNEFYISHMFLFFSQDRNMTFLHLSFLRNNIQIKPQMQFPRKAEGWAATCRKCRWLSVVMYVLMVVSRYHLRQKTNTVSQKNGANFCFYALKFTTQVTQATAQDLLWWPRFIFFIFHSVLCVWSLFSSSKTFQLHLMYKKLLYK